MSPDDVMPGDVKEVTVCRVCSANRWVEILSFGPTPLANRYVHPDEPPEDEPLFPLDVLFCTRCGLLSLKQVVDPRVLYLHYVYISSESAMIQTHTRWLADQIVAMCGLDSNSLVVEFGSNMGSQLENFKARGVRVLGVDPARNLADVANRKGIPTLPDFFTVECAKEILARAGAPDVVLGRHVFAHIDDLSGVFAALDACLGPEGVIAIEVPYVADMVDGNEFDTIYHEHLSYFSVGTLDHLFRRHAYRLFDVVRVAVHGGSMIVFGCRETARWSRSARLTGLLEEERARGLAAEDYYLEFGRRARQIRVELKRLVADLKRGGARIVGYGAPAKGNSLLSYCGIGGTELDFVTDTTELKQGMLLPGTRVPIRPESYGKQHPPDYFLLLAWNYATEIIRKEMEFIAGGGKFIVPIPWPAVVSAENVQGFLQQGRGGRAAVS